MLKKLLLVVVFALQFFAVSTGSLTHDPVPECWPCPISR